MNLEKVLQVEERVGRESDAPLDRRRNNHNSSRWRTASTGLYRRMIGIRNVSLLC